MKFKTIIIHKKEKDSELKFNSLSSLCLEHGLHNKTDNSRMKSIFNAPNEFSGCYAILVYEENKPIAICYLKHNDFKNIMGTIRENPNSNIEKHYDHWCLNRAGTNNSGSKKINLFFDFWIANPGLVMFYVNEEYRHQDIAKTLAVKMGNLVNKEYLNICKQNGHIKEGSIDDCILIAAREKAINLIHKNCKNVQVSHNGLEVTDGNYPHAITGLTYKKVFVDNLDFKVVSHQNKNSKLKI